MAQVNKIDSNNTGLRYAEETATIGVLPGTPDWIPLEPNSYSDFGGEITNIARNPINDGRQRQKGVTVDLDASGGFNSDLTQTNFEDILQGFFFADAVRKGEEVVTSITGGGATNDYNVALTAGFQVGNLVLASGFTADASNNGLKTVDGVTLDTLVSVSETLVNDAGPPADAQLVVVGFEGAAGDIDVDASGTLPVLTSTTADFTTMGLSPGEWIRIGGDAAANAFTNAVNNGFARVRTIAANALTLDKTQATMVTESSTTETIHLFFGRVLKNQLAGSIVRRTYSLERTLGAPDDASPAQIQAEYLDGAVPNEITFNFNTADKITADLSFVAIDHQTIDGPTALRTGNRPALISEEGYNTSNDFARLKMHVLDPTTSNPTALFAFLTEFTISINNNVSPNKAISVLGAFDATAGQFQVDGSATAYFSNVAAMAALRNNSDVTIDFTIVHGDAGSKTGVSVDMPLLALGDGRANVEQDAPITLPLTQAAGADRVFNHTLLMTFYDYLPDVADPSP